MYDENNIFAKIIRGEITCDKIFEDKDVLFFKSRFIISSVKHIGNPKRSLPVMNFSNF